MALARPVVPDDADPFPEPHLEVERLRQAAEFQLFAHERSLPSAITAEAHLDVLLPQVEEYLPAELLAEAGVPSLRDALSAVHRPTTLASALAGRARLAYEELLFVHILHRRARRLQAAKILLLNMPRINRRLRFRKAHPHQGIKQVMPRVLARLHLAV